MAERVSSGAIDTLTADQDQSSDVIVELAREFDWVSAVVIARLVRRSAITLAVTTGRHPEPARIYVEARERLIRASTAVLGAATAVVAPDEPDLPNAETR